MSKVYVSKFEIVIFRDKGFYPINGADWRTKFETTSFDEAVNYRNEMAAKFPDYQYFIREID